MADTVNTSQNNPLRIAELPAGSDGGVIGITFAPGKQQADGNSGAHKRDLAADLDRIAAWNAAMIVTLVQPQELDGLGIARLGEFTRARHVEWEHWPITDYGVPCPLFAAAWPELSARVRQLLACGGRVLIHCKGGLGRAGMVSARLLAELGHEPGDAIAMVRAVRPRAVENAAQEGWVAAAKDMPQAASPAVPAGRDRARGALLGLAVGDAIGAAIEFSAKPRFALIDDMVGGGPHGLEPGQWTDDTAMALALADSLLASSEFNPSDLMQRFLAWYDRGTYSCTGTCFDIGNQTRAALETFRGTGEPYAGQTGHAAGNGALMRLAPVAIRHRHDLATALSVAEQQTRTTHGSAPTLAASRAFTDLLVQALSGVTLPELLASPAADIAGGWRGLHRNEIEGSGFVTRSIQAAIWAVSRTTSFRSAVLLAANLGDDADTTAAIAGQLAGAVYGAAAIPEAWRQAVAWRTRIEAVADRLFDHGQSPIAALKALAAFNAVLDCAVVKDGLIEPGGYALAEQESRFSDEMYRHRWVRPFNWSAWSRTGPGRALLHDAQAMMQAEEDDLARVITVCLRGDRFSDGTLAEAFRSGLISRITARAAALLKHRIAS